ncbi:MAG: small basic family protein [Clostridia bacterium]|nr:small basic family protein [Clostridia bacterium]
MFFIIAVLVGILLGILIPYNLNSSMLSYVAVALIAALDSVFGGLLANLNKRFNINVFMIGLVSNAILGIFLTVIGNILGISLSFAVIIVFGVRMFNNMAAIRRLTFDRYFEKKAREREREARFKLESAKDETELEDFEDIEDVEEVTEEKTVEENREETEKSESDVEK